MTSRYAEVTFFLALLAKAVSHKASDIHLKAGRPPGLRIDEGLVYFRTDPITPLDMLALARFIVRDEATVAQLEELQEYDTAYSAPGIGRFRANVYRQRGSLGIVMRFIPYEVPALDSLGLPMPVTRELASKPNGLVVVVGAAGHGKTTSVAGMIADLNATRPLHIVTVEDPIEFLHRDKLSSISQREVGLDTESFPKALRAALRQDPDVIVIGEIRDEESMEIALKAAETGHLVLATLHTIDAAHAVQRMLALLRGDPVDNRTRIASCLQGVIAQRIVPRAGGAGSVLAAEVLVASASVRESIRQPEGNPSLKSLMEKGAHPYGMQTFAMAVQRLIHAGLVDGAAEE